MAILTNIGRLHMSVVLAGYRQSVMAVVTVRCTDTMFECPVLPINRIMARFTIVAALDMVRSLGVGMTAVTGAEHLVMIHPHYRLPLRVGVTTLADIAGLNMGVVFAGNGWSVVASAATARRIIVTEIGRRPARCRVTLQTVRLDRDMVGIHAIGNGAVVATVAAADHIGMVHPNHRLPIRVAVAILAHIVGRHMLGILTFQRGHPMTT